MKELESEVNRVWNIAVYLQMMAAFSDDLDFDEYRKVMLEFHDVIEQGNDVKSKLPDYEKLLISIAKGLEDKYPLKRTYDQIASSWNEHFQINKEFLSTGVQIGWLDEQVDLTLYYRYDYYPYHFKVGLAIHKGRGEIEEHFLLKDSFTCLVKAKNRINILNRFGEFKKHRFKDENKTSFDKETLDSLNNIKYEVSFYSRMTVVSFFSFLESFINSIGFDFYYRNKNFLDSDTTEILQGSKKGRFLNLKYKIEKFQKIVRSDKSSKIILSDEKQIKDPFKTLFWEYEELRNASIHFSPNKTKIWLKPHDWIEKAEVFSKLTLEAALEIWKVCHETNKGPDYLGRLDYDKLFETALNHGEKVNEIEKQIQ
jgi:hypothetical protein